MLLRKLTSSTANYAGFSARANYSSCSAIDLEFSEQIPKNGNRTESALVILHGLFGSKRNWSSFMKAFTRDLDAPVYALDLRNHGHSQHTSPMTYSAMAADVLRFIEQKSLSQVSLLGHSMGGKVAMTVALNPASALSHLIVADIAPNRGQLSDEFSSYIEAMKRIESMKLQTRKEAERALAEYEKDSNVLLFLLTNIILPKESGSDHIRFRIPLGTLSDAIPNLGSFPFRPGETKWGGKTLFIKGTKSNFIKDSDYPTMKEFFPSMKLETLDAGHWVHAEQ
ncbi:hypothetical protein D9757_012782 [Collybiopsis confluens]|uniref:AB hydrolase-1 domain-containing protein n=1 Tax=Collybiopsis confluens TaxID=2823264 RepID=A0A8H5CVQ6_9AGAR|nr:hypothetical protein D9757_012782 [Collybiopsis confluens]